MNYPGRGPETSYLVETGRVKACYAFDKEVFEAARVMCHTEGLIPALETAHAIAYILKYKEEFGKDEIVVLSYSGRGDKDLEIIT
ncbi:tryptophan synthase subunit beta, partial [Candidatus Bathyarchaeota archaeon]|nr:tryptophan synthase subunit beta [Candidatus Bathyarchaeota archaeon]